MSFEDIQDEEISITKIREKLIEASDLYYNDSASNISDEEFDNLRDLLLKLSPDDSFFKMVGAPVKTSEWKKEKHKIPMGSLNKVNTKEEFFNWVKQVNQVNPEEYINYVLSCKLDGISIDLEYKNGKLIKAITRGDGCLFKETLIEFENGDRKTIEEVVQYKIEGKIKTFNIDKKVVEFKNILNWFDNGESQNWFELEYEFENTTKKIILTENHYVWLPEISCYRQVKDLTENDHILIN